MTNFGSGPTLREACSWLQDDAQRHQQILDVTERNSVIEGLPPLRDETRLRILQRLMNPTNPRGPSVAPVE